MTCTSAISAISVGIMTMSPNFLSNTSYTERFPKENIIDNIKSVQDLSINWNSEDTITIRERKVDENLSYGKIEEKIQNKIILESEIVMSILKDESYNWWSLKAISRETELPENIVDKNLKELEESGLLFIGTFQKNNEKIYSLIEHYEKNTKLLVRMLDAMRGKIIR